MDELKVFFQLVSKLKEMTNNTNFEEMVFNAYEKIKNLEILNNELINEKEVLIKNINDKDNIIKEKNEELANYKKSSILSSMDKQVNEQKNYISIIEQQLKQYKNQQVPVNHPEQIIEVVKEEIKEEVKEEIKEEVKEIVNEELEPEYESVEYKNRKYYLIGKKVYRINKDKSLGEYYGKYKNGEVIKT
jgi:hypothetical protein